FGVAWPGRHQPQVCALTHHREAIGGTDRAQQLFGVVELEASRQHQFFQSGRGRQDHRSAVAIERLDQIAQPHFIGIEPIVPPILLRWSEPAWRAGGGAVEAGAPACGNQHAGVGVARPEPHAPAKHGQLHFV
ncbi:hypothetical protein CEE94_12295, partial [Lactobacillus crispatus]